MEPVEPQRPEEDEDDRAPRVGGGGGVWNNLVLLVGSVALIATVAWGIPYTVEELQKTGGFRPEIILPVILIIGLITLIGALAALAATFSRLDLASRGAPLGMPEGSVQAVIALGLIIIFAIVGVYLIGMTEPTRLLPGLTREEMEALPRNTIVEIDGVGRGEYDVRIAVSDSNQHELALQLLTTVSTLVVAVAAFYFGQKSVGEARKAIVGQPPIVTPPTKPTPKIPVSQQKPKRPASGKPPPAKRRRPRFRRRRRDDRG